MLARFDYTVDDIPLETNSNVMLQLSNGASGNLWSSIVAVGQDADVRIRIYGTEGSLNGIMQAGPSEICPPGRTGAVSGHDRDYNGADSLSMSHLPAGHPEGYYEAFGNIYERFCKDVIARQEGATEKKYDYPDIDYGIHGVRFVMPVWKATKRVMSGLHCNGIFVIRRQWSLRFIWEESEAPLY